jgi:hypothetical protein
VPALTHLQLENGVLGWPACLGASGGGAAAALAAALRHTPALRRLSLPNNLIDSAGATALASQLHCIPLLTQLDLDNNPIGASGAVAVASALAAGRHLALERLSMCGCAGVGTSGDTYLALARAIAHAPSLREADVSGDPTARRQEFCEHAVGSCTATEEALLGGLMDMSAYRCGDAWCDYLQATVLPRVCGLHQERRAQRNATPWCFTVCDAHCDFQRNGSARDASIVAASGTGSLPEPPFWRRCLEAWVEERCWAKRRHIVTAWVAVRAAMAAGGIVMIM